MKKKLECITYHVNNLFQAIKMNALKLIFGERLKFSFLTFNFFQELTVDVHTRVFLIG